MLNRLGNAARLLRCTVRDTGQRQVSGPADVRLGPDDYVRSVLARYELPSGPGSPAEKAAAELHEPIRRWAGRYLIGIQFAGSYLHRTRIKGATDIDLLLALGPRTPMDAPKFYEHCFAWLKSHAFAPRRRRVSIGLDYHGLAIDLIPAKQEWGASNDYQLFATERRHAVRTNFETHQKTIEKSGRQREIRALKVWRDNRGLVFPSFYLELVVIDALRNRPADLLAGNVEVALRYLRDVLPGVPIRDPANHENLVSDDLLEHEKLAIGDAAGESLKQKLWNQVIW